MFFSVHVYKFETSKRDFPPPQDEAFKCERYLQGHIEFLLFEPVLQHNREEESLSR